MSAFIDISGKRFGKLVAIKVSGRKPKSDKGVLILWECKCDCGNTYITTRSNLYKAKSCGCSRIEHLKNLGRKKRKPVGYSARNKLMKKYEAQARYRNLEFKLSKEQFNEITKQNCHYCGKEPSQIVNLKGCNGTYTYNGIDRVDNTKGYTIDNCVPCCVTCNKSKMEMSVDEFYAWIDRVYYHRHTDLAFESSPFIGVSWEQPWGDGTAEWYQRLSEELGESK